MITRLIFRGGGLFAKFVLVFAISNVLGLGAISIYGVAVAAAVVASKVFGLGFSSEVNRRLSTAECGLSTPLKTISISSFIAIAVSAIVAMHAPRLGVSATNGCILMILGVAVTEYVSYEINCFVFSVGRSNIGAVLMFVKTGGWAGFACVGLFSGHINHIEQVLLMWCIANVAVMLTGAVAVFKAVRCWGGTVSLACLLARGGPYYASAIFISVTQYADRFVLARFATADVLGRYVLSWSVANVIQALTYAVVTVVALPQLAKSARMARVLLPRQYVFCNGWVLRAAVVATSLFFLLIGGVLISNVAVAQRFELPDLALSALLGGAFVMRAVNDVIVGGMIACGQWSASLMSSVATMFLSLPLYVALTQSFQSAGAAVAAVVSSALGIVLAFVAMRTMPQVSDCYEN